MTVKDPFYRQFLFFSYSTAGLFHLFATETKKSCVVNRLPDVIIKLKFIYIHNSAIIDMNAFVAPENLYTSINKLYTRLPNMLKKIPRVVGCKQKLDLHHP